MELSNLIKELQLQSPAFYHSVARAAYYSNLEDQTEESLFWGLEGNDKVYDTYLEAYEFLAEELEAFIEGGMHHYDNLHTQLQEALSEYWFSDEGGNTLLEGEGYYGYDRGDAKSLKYPEGSGWYCAEHEAGFFWERGKVKPEWYTYVREQRAILDGVEGYRLRYREVKEWLQQAPVAEKKPSYFDSVSYYTIEAAYFGAPGLPDVLQASLDKFLEAGENGNLCQFTDEDGKTRWYYTNQR